MLCNQRSVNETNSCKICKMPKGRRKPKFTRQKFKHNECRMRACIWCGKRKTPGSVRELTQAQLLLVQKHGNPSLDPATDNLLPKVICSTCRLGLSELESPPATGIKNHLPSLFNWGYVEYKCMLLIASYELSLLNHHIYMC